MISDRKHCTSGVPLAWGVIPIVGVTCLCDAIARRSGYCVCNEHLVFGWASALSQEFLGMAYIAASVLLLIVRWAYLLRSPMTRAGVDLIAGGGISNGIARLMWGCVWDWIPVGSLWGNAADVAIDLGIVAIVLGSMLGLRRDESVK